MNPQLTGGRCQCPACGEYFSSVREFDRHRVGNFAESGQLMHTRRCLTVAELSARGWRRDARGFRMQGRPRRTLAEAVMPSQATVTKEAPGVLP